MKVVIIDTINGYDAKPTVREFATIEELMKFKDETGEALVINKNRYYKDYEYIADNEITENVEEIANCEYEIRVEDFAWVETLI